MTEIFNDRKQASQDDKAEVEHVDWATTLAPGGASIEDLPEQQYNLSVYLAMLAIAMLNFAQLFALLSLNANGRFFGQIVGGAGETIWLGESLAIGTATMSPMMAKASDLWGRRYILLGSSVLAVVGSIIIARCTSMNMCIAGAVLLGISFGIQPLLFAIPAEIMPRKHRNYAIGIANVAAGIGAMGGLIVGGALTMNGHSERIRIAGFFGLAGVITFFCYHPPRRPSQIGRTTKEKLRSMDWVGYFLFAACLTCLIMGLSWAENPYPWVSGHVLAPVCLSGVSAVLLVLQQWKFKKHDALFDRLIFAQSKNAALGLVIISLEGIVFWVASSYLPQLLAVVYEPSELMVSVRFAFIFYGSLPLVLLFSWYASRYRDVRSIGVVGFLGFTIMAACFASANVDQNAAVWAFTFFGCIGQAGGLVSIFTAAQFGAPADLVADLTALLISLRSFGGAVGLGACSAIFNSQAAKTIGPTVASRVLPLGLPVSSLGALIGGISSFHFADLPLIPGVTPEIIQAGVLGFKEGFLRSQRGNWILMAAMSFLGAIVICFISNHKEMYVDRTDAPLTARTAELKEDGVVVESA